ncbi:DUF6197 family protein [Streptomyces sp. NPDC002092]
MVTLSVTRSRIRTTLTVAAGILDIEGWDPLQNPIADAIDRAAGFTPGKGSSSAETVTVLALDMLTDHLGLGEPDGSGHYPLILWERQPGRTEDEVLAALRAAGATS